MEALVFKPPSHHPPRKRQPDAEELRLAEWNMNDASSRTSQVPCARRLKYLWLLLRSTHRLFPACWVLFIGLSAKAACGRALTVRRISGAGDSGPINGTVFYLLQSALWCTACCFLSFHFDFVLSSFSLSLSSPSFYLYPLIIWAPPLRPVFFSCCNRWSLPFTPSVARERVWVVSRSISIPLAPDIDRCPQEAASRPRGTLDGVG